MQQNIFDDENFFNKYIKLRGNPQGHNELIEKPALISLLPAINNYTVLDLGCGHGDLSRELVKLGAKKVIAVDMSNRMLSHAKLYDNHNIEYVACDMINMKKVDNQFDLVVSSLAIHYIEDYKSVVEYTYNNLKKNSFFIFSIEHPVYTAPLTNNDDSWELSKNQEKLSWKLNSYFLEGKRIKDWLVPNVEKYHRKLETYISELSQIGFTINTIIEPSVYEKQLMSNKSLAYEKIRPPYLMIKAQKQFLT